MFSGTAISGTVVSGGIVSGKVVSGMGVVSLLDAPPCVLADAWREGRAPLFFVCLGRGDCPVPLQGFPGGCLSW